jgi:hypothetical protein
MDGGIERHSVQATRLSGSRLQDRNNQGRLNNPVCLRKGTLEWGTSCVWEDIAADQRGFFRLPEHRVSEIAHPDSVCWIVKRDVRSDDERSLSEVE